MISDPASAAPSLSLNGVEVVDTFAEAFPIKAARLVITAVNRHWAATAAAVLCGNATSVIACDVEAAVERDVPEAETPDGRPGVSVLAFGFSRESLEKALQSRVGQCVLTCPTTACFNGIVGTTKDKQIRIGGGIRYFGDGYQRSKKFGDCRYWRIPVMDGEFLCEDRFGVVTGVAGGNLLICGKRVAPTLAAAEAAVAAIRSGVDVALPFPGGIVRSGSKVGSKKYSKLKASTNDAYCPTLRALAPSELPKDCHAVYEIVIDGLSYDAVREAMRRGLHAAAMPDVLRITAGNYGGKLGKHHFPLRDLL